MTLYAISVDSPADSARFARDLEFPFPMLSDPGGAVGRRYVGFNTDDDTDIPGVVVIRADGTVAFRQIATTKDDRLTADQLLAVVDRTFGTTGPAATRVSPLDRMQLRVDAGGGIAIRSPIHDVELVSASLLVPLGRHVLIGSWFAYDAYRGAKVAAALELRVPILGDAGAISLGTTAGVDDHGRPDLAARAGLWFALSPRWAVQLGVAYEVEHADGEALVTLGVGRLFGR